MLRQSEARFWVALSVMGTTPQGSTSKMVGGTRHLRAVPETGDVEGLARDLPNTFAPDAATPRNA